MTRYHINRKGDPGICSAQANNCPFGGENEHYDSKEAAFDSLASQYETLPNDPKRLISEDTMARYGNVFAIKDLRAVNEELAELSDGRYSLNNNFTYEYTGVLPPQYTAMGIQSIHEINFPAESDLTLVAMNHKGNLVGLIGYGPPDDEEELGTAVPLGELLTPKNILHYGEDAAEEIVAKRDGRDFIYSDRSPTMLKITNVYRRFFDLSEWY